MATKNLVVNGDFSAGNSDFSTDYQYVPAIYSETQYTVIAASRIDASQLYGPNQWPSVTTGPLGVDENVLLVNGAVAADQQVWRELVTVTPNTSYVFSFYAADVNDRPGNNAILDASINGVRCWPAKHDAFLAAG
jgi:hypothetical protein